MGNPDTITCTSDYVFFHCKKCGHISKSAKVEGLTSYKTLSSNMVAWLQKLCIRCNEPVEPESH